MRVVHLNSMLKGGGTDEQCLALTRGLLQLEQAVWLAGLDGRPLISAAQSLGIPLHTTPVEGPLKLRLILSVARFLRREQIQILHAHHGRDYWPAVLAARLSGVKTKVVISRHLAKSPGSALSRGWLLSQCDALVAVSEFTAHVLREGHYEPDSPEPERHARPPMRGDHAKIHVVPCGIDTDQFQPGDGSRLRHEWGLLPEHYAFAVVGGYDHPRGKGQREFLAVAARIHQDIPQARFLIVGRGTLEPVLMDDIQRLGLAGKAWLTPYCTDMPQAMNALDCLVHPAIGTEAFGLVVLEAFACGKPVIAAALDGIPEAFAAGNHGTLVRPESPEELAQAMIWWANQQPKDLAGRRELHQRIAIGYSYQMAARKLLQVYRTIQSEL